MSENLGHLTTEARNPASTHLDSLSALELVRLMNAEDARAVAAVGAVAANIAAAVELIADRLRRGGRLLYCGAGTSGRLGVLDAAECPPTFSTPPELVVGVIAGGPPALTRAVEGAEDHPEAGAADLAARNVAARDAVVGIATSGRTPYVLGAVRFAREQGAATIGIDCNPRSRLAELVDVSISVVVGPEILSGSTRLKAGTATKLVLNMLSTGTMVQLGKTYGNLMVDLRATNSKLVDRARRILCDLTGMSPEAAGETLAQCQGELKTAIVVVRLGIPPEVARRRLADAGGQLRAVLAGP